MEKAKLAIDNCRQKINDIDRKLLVLVKERELLSAQIGQLKRELSIPDKDFSREHAVFEHAIACAHELDLPESFAIKMSELVMGLSLSRQERDRIRHNLASAPLSVAVIGGSGRLGRWLCHFFADSGHTITVIDQVKPDFLCSYQTSFDATITNHDLIIVATPIRVSSDMLNQLGTYNLAKPVIFDVSSVKAPVRQALLKLSQQGAKVTSLHPMFGPSVEVLFGKHIIITSVANNQADNFAKKLFKSTSVSMVDMSFDQHDQIIAYLLSLSHLLNIIFIGALEHSGFSIDFLSRFSSTTFSNLLSIAQRVFSENPQLYYEIQALNPYNQACYQALSRSLASTLSAINTTDEQAFVILMRAGQNYLGAKT